MALDKETKRHVIGLLLGCPLFLTCFLLRSPYDLRHITAADEWTVYIANYVGDASFALTGTLAGGTAGMDLYGCIVVGFLTALGGGTVRDIALGRLPIFWATNWDEALLCVVVSLVAFFAWPQLSKAFKLSLNDDWLFWTDTLGLGVFAALGAQTAASMPQKIHFGFCSVSGMFTATLGGLSRDILCQKPPRILYAEKEVYALPAFIGAMVTTAVLRFLGENLVLEAVLLGIWITIEMRILAVNHGLRLPVLPEDLRKYARSPALSWASEPLNPPPGSKLHAPITLV
mmetsp:Transcript_88473/g.184889  ORF Transcript_88473/g.184889 Transcript_88473/m.184889 type:complete len:287 (-) Transcript_88473:86-946(-)